MVFARSSALILALSVSPCAIAADLTILAVGPFGHPVQGCRVDRFRAATDEGGSRRQYSDRFQGLVGKQLPLGIYELRIVCGEAEANKQITVSHASQFKVVAFSGRHLISDHVKPRLTIKLDTSPPVGETWWIRFVGLYNAEIYTDRFVPQLLGNYAGRFSPT